MREEEYGKTKEKGISLTLLALLFLALLTLSVNTKSVKASGTIYIRADGSVDPSTAPIVSIDNITYSFNSSIYESIVVEKDNIIVDGEDYVVQGTGSGTGIAIAERNNVTIRNASIKAFGYGIQLQSANNSNIFDSNITANWNAGIWLSASAHNSIVGNNITSSAFYGIYLNSSSNINISGNNIANCSLSGITLQSSNNNIVGNNITGSTYGIWLNGCSNNNLSKNAMNDNSYNLYVVGSVPEDFMHPIDPSNLANGKPIYYLSNQNGLTINPATSPQVGYLALIECANITVENLSLSNNGHGLLLVKTNDSRVANNNITNNIIGMELFSSWNNNLSNNNISNNTGGLWLHRSTNNTMSDNNVAGSSGYGIALFSSSNDNIVIGNNVTASETYGIYLPSLNDRVFHNNLRNKNQVRALPKTNILDDGYPSGGNYWSNYNGTDLYSGPYQNETGSDGIGDQPVVINAKNTDRYPLMKSYPWSHHDIGVTYIGKVYFEFSKVLPMKTNLAQGLVTYFDIIIMNYGDQAELVNVTAYANTTPIATILDVSVPSRSSIIVTFRWNTSNCVKGNCAISALAWPVSGETDATDNIYTGSDMLVTVIGDVNGDGQVSNNDLFDIANNFGTQPTDPRWNPNYDVNDDTYVGIDDIFIAATHLGEKDP
jgi:parallel beta-helix repeat protein